MSGLRKKNKDHAQEEAPSPSLIGKMRRRLTVGGTSTAIDGVANLTVADEDRKNESSLTNGSAVTEFAGLSQKGHAPYNPRKKNQDALIMTNHEETNTLVLCVLDGHGEHGDSVSAHFANNLAKRMFAHPKWVSDIKAASRDAILSCEDEVLSMIRVDTEFSGTTLSMALVRDKILYGVNIGDSRVVVAKGCAEDKSKIVAEEFTHDHKPDDPEEKKRIIKAGGRVFAVAYDDGIDGPPRVWLGHMDVPGLAMSRSLGDTVAHTAGVISEPEFTERKLNPDEDKFILVATDGLWEFMTNEECVDMAVETGRGNAQRSVDVLVEEARARWMREEQVIDDTTVIVGHLFNYGSKRS